MMARKLPGKENQSVSRPRRVERRLKRKTFHERWMRFVGARAPAARKPPAENEG